MQLSQNDHRKPRPCWVDVITTSTFGCSRGSDVWCFGLERRGEERRGEERRGSVPRRRRLREKYQDQKYYGS